MIHYQLNPNYIEIKKPSSRRFQIIGFIRERNESLVLQDTLDEMSKIVDAIVIFDDASADNSVSIALQHPKVISVIINKHWLDQIDRSSEETLQRGAALTVSMSYKPKWLLYQDADERIEDPQTVRNFMLQNIRNKEIESVTFSLYDAYITKNDKTPYLDGPLFNFRQMFGIERREIPMAWKASKDIRYPEEIKDLRIPVGIDPQKTIKKFYVQHYGKSLSIDQWEETCDYYIKHFPGYAEKWKKRKGKAIHHKKSDFDTNLMTWEEVKKDGGILI